MGKSYSSNDLAIIQLRKNLNRYKGEKRAAIECAINALKDVDDLYNALGLYPYDFKDYAFRVLKYRSNEERWAGYDK